MLDDHLKTGCNECFGNSCARRIPLHIRDELVVQFRFDGDAVVLFEKVLGSEYQPSGRKATWRAFDTTQNISLESGVRDQHGQRHDYERPTAGFAQLLGEVDRDPTAILFGADAVVDLRVARALGVAPLVSFVAEAAGSHDVRRHRHGYRNRCTDEVSPTLRIAGKTSSRRHLNARTGTASSVVEVVELIRSEAAAAGQPGLFLATN